MAENSTERSLGEVALLIAGWILLFILYSGQVFLLVWIMAIHFENNSYIAWLLWFLPAVGYTVYFLFKNRKLENNDESNDVRIWDIWMIWDLYIVFYVLTVGMIFDRVAHKLTKHDDLGINALKSTLCITPAMLMLFLQLAISQPYRKSVLSLSILAALNIFDGIEMLETFLMENEGHFDLNEHTEKSIIAFACICFLLTSLGLARNKFESDGNVKERTMTSIVFGLLEMIGTNLPFLVIRSYIWHVHGYEAAVFIAKNIVSLVAGAVEFGILIKMAIDKRKEQAEQNSVSDVVDQAHS